jgi:hypothetical protein
MTDDLRQDEAPRKLREALSVFSATPNPVPSAVDDAVLTMARGKLARRARIFTLRRVASFAAAAVVLLAVGLTVFAPRESAMPSRMVSVNAPTMNVNGDGQVDILDAFALARSITLGDKDLHRWDFSRDRAVDARDVEMIAMAAVSLNKGAVR